MRVCVHVRVRGVCGVCVCACARTPGGACATARPLPATRRHAFLDDTSRAQPTAARARRAAAVKALRECDRIRSAPPRSRGSGSSSATCTACSTRMRGGPTGTTSTCRRTRARPSPQWMRRTPMWSSCSGNRPAPSPRRERQPSARSRSRSTAQPAPGGSAKGGLPLQERRSPGQPRAGSERRQRRHGRGGSVVVVVVVVSFWQRPYGRGKQASHACRCTARDGSAALLRTMWVYRQVRRPCSVRTACATLAATSSSVGTAGTSVPPVVKLAERPSVA